MLIISQSAWFPAEINNNCTCMVLYGICHPAPTEPNKTVSPSLGTASCGADMEIYCSEIAHYNNPSPHCQKMTLKKLYVVLCS